jgi:hypothetical protein
VCVAGVLVAILVIEERLVVISYVFEPIGRWSIKMCCAVDMDNPDIVLVAGTVLSSKGNREIVNSNGPR